MCYKDKTFCKEDTCSNWDKCDRALTPEVKEKAWVWWGSKFAPVMAYTERPDCYEEKK